MIKNRWVLVAALSCVFGEKNLMALSEPPSVQWSVDGGTMVVISGTAVMTFDAVGNPMKSYPVDVTAHYIMLSPDGTKAAYILQGQQVWILDLVGGSKNQIFAVSSLMQFCSSLKWSTNGQNLTFSVINGSVNQGQIYLIRPDGSGKMLLYTFSL